MASQEEIFPVNQKRKGRVALGPHYAESVRVMGLDAEKLPDCLFFTFCGDILGSSGEHYKKGASISFADASERASLNFSDDFMESVAMHRMPAMPRHYDLETLIRYRDIFHDFIRDHFLAAGQTYSPWFGALFNASTLYDYADILQAHSSCGAAMRATIIAVDGHSDVDALPYFLISHGHVEAIEGAYAVMGMARAAVRGDDFDAALAEAEKTAANGRRLFGNFQQRQGWPEQNYPPLGPILRAVLAADDAYLPAESMEKDGIETRFVLPAAFLCVRAAMRQGDNVRRGVETLITTALRIGGDPDTICSIALGLYGSFQPKETKSVLSDCTIGGF